ncbi:MAG: nitroreductase/quinone reductase family protein [Acidimicrobiia bacterium]|nr:nitroreductase/quinone reductase family protein [Acidimicrobiia bacterium]
MNVTEAQIAKLRAAFRLLNRFMLVMWRLGWGSTMAGPRRGYLMVLVTTGRKSGLRRLAPLNFAADPGVVYCIAGFGKTTHWLVNLLADPACEVWLPDGRRVHGVGEIVTDEAERIDVVRRVLIRAGFAAKLFEPDVDPYQAPDEQIANLGEKYGRRYEAVRIDLRGDVTGPGGPGDLVWVPPLLGAGALAAAIGWRLRRRR